MLIVSGLGARPAHYVHSLRAGNKASTLCSWSQGWEQGQYTIYMYAHSLRAGSTASTLCSWSQGWEQGQYTMLIVSGLGALPVHYAHGLRAGSKASTLYTCMLIVFGLGARPAHYLNDEHMLDNINF